MKQSNSTLKKIDIFWTIFSIVNLSISIYLWQTGKDYFLSSMFVVWGLIFCVQKLISKKLFNIIRVFLSLGILYYVVKLIME
jgi:hypothetical protein